MITGDKNFGPGHPRYELQRSAVNELRLVYWGRGSLWPKIPAGKFDVVTSQDPFWRGLFAWRVARRMGARLNIQVHTSVLNTLGRFILRRADSVRVVSEKIKKQVECIGVGASVRVLPVYVDLSKFRNIARHSSKSDLLEKTLLWVGRFEDEKDPILALKVIAQLPSAKLIMLGAGSCVLALRKEISRLNLDTRVVLPGWGDTTKYLSQADVVLCTSKHESWGASIVEALAAGVPVVAPDVGVAREAGAIVVPREKLAEKVAEVLESGQRGELKLKLPDAQEWAARWKETL